MYIYTYIEQMHGISASKHILSSLIIKHFGTAINKRFYFILIWRNKKYHYKCIHLYYLPRTIKPINHHTCFAITFAVSTTDRFSCLNSEDFVHIPTIYPNVTAPTNLKISVIFHTCTSILLIYFLLKYLYRLWKDFWCVIRIKLSC